MSPDALSITLFLEIKIICFKKYIRMWSLLKKLKKLNIPEDNYAIFGGACLAARGIRETDDLDVVVSDDFYKTLTVKYEEKEPGKIEMENGSIEIYSAWNSLMDYPEEVIKRSEDINGYRFVLLKDVLEWKKKMGREKDIKDIKLIRSYGY